MMDYNILLLKRVHGPFLAWAYAQGGPGGPWPTPNSEEKFNYR
jgi:hypothetical protein